MLSLCGAVLPRHVAVCSIRHPGDVPIVMAVQVGRVFRLVFLLIDNKYSTGTLQAHMHRRTGPRHHETDMETG